MRVWLCETTSVPCTDHVVKKNPRPSPSVFAYRKLSKTGGGEDLRGLRSLLPTLISPTGNHFVIFAFSTLYRKIQHCTTSSRSPGK